MDSTTKINKLQFTFYNNCCYKTGLKRYAKYLDKSGKEKDQELTINDISIIDKIPISVLVNKFK